MVVLPKQQVNVFAASKSANVTALQQHAAYDDAVNVHAACLHSLA